MPIHDVLDPLAVEVDGLERGDPEVGHRQVDGGEERVHRDHPALPLQATISPVPSSSTSATRSRVRSSPKNVARSKLCHSLGRRSRRRAADEVPVGQAADDLQDTVVVGVGDPNRCEAQRVGAGRSHCTAWVRPSRHQRAFVDVAGGEEDLELGIGVDVRDLQAPGPDPVRAGGRGALVLELLATAS